MVLNNATQSDEVTTEVIHSNRKVTPNNQWAGPDGEKLSLYI